MFRPERTRFAFHHHNWLAWHAHDASGIPTPLPFLKATNADGHRLPRDLAFVLRVRVRSIAIDGDAAVARSAAGVELVPVERAEASSAAKANKGGASRSAL